VDSKSPSMKKLEVLNGGGPAPSDPERKYCGRVYMIYLGGQRINAQVHTCLVRNSQTVGTSRTCTMKIKGIPMIFPPTNRMPVLSSSGIG
jgi:hypothetical protein